MNSTEHHRDQPRLWTLDETAAYLGKTPSALSTMRWRGVGPVGFRVGRHVRFRPEDVVAWAAAQALAANEANEQAR